MRHNALINNRKIFTRRVVYDMDTEETSQNVPKALIFSSPEGHTLCRLILATLLPYEPHVGANLKVLLVNYFSWKE